MSDPTPTPNTKPTWKSTEFLLIVFYLALIAFAGSSGNAELQTYLLEYKTQLAAMIGIHSLGRSSTKVAETIKQGGTDA